MTTDTVFDNHLKWARDRTFAGTARDNAQAEAVSAWSTISAPDKADFRSRIESVNEARALEIEARTYLKNRDLTGTDLTNFNWATQGQWLPLLNKTPANMSDTEIMQLDSLRRVLAAYISAAQCYKTTLEQLLPLYTQFSMQNAFDGPTNAEIARLAATLALAPAVSQRTNLTLLETICDLPEVRVKLQQANRDVVWIPGVNLFENNGKNLDKLWIYLAFNNDGKVVDVSQYNAQGRCLY